MSNIDESRCRFRDVGFTSKASQLPRDEMALAMLAAFNNVRPDQLTEGMKFFPNNSTREAWARVAEAARIFIESKWISEPFLADINNMGDGWVQVTISGDGAEHLTEAEIEAALSRNKKP